MINHRYKIKSTCIYIYIRKRKSFAGRQACMHAFYPLHLFYCKKRSNNHVHVRLTVGGPGDWNIHLNVALGRESRSAFVLQIGEVIGSILNAFTRIPLVLGGRSACLDVLHAFAAFTRRFTSLGEIRNAWGQTRTHLLACYRRLAWPRHEEEQLNHGYHHQHWHNSPLHSIFF